MVLVREGFLRVFAIGVVLIEGIIILGVEYLVLHNGCGVVRGECLGFVVEVTWARVK